MKRALAIFCVVTLTGCPGLDGWSEALSAYYERTAVPDASVGFPNGQRCGANSDCESGQCRVGVCIVDAPVGNGPVQCGDDDDCGSEARDGGRVCEPASASGAGAYTCLPFTSCGKTGRVCRDNTDCFTAAGGCTSGCDRGICKVLGCLRQDAPCTTQSECCSGYLCTGPVADGGLVVGSARCVLSAPNVIPLGDLCSASDQCVSKFCSTGVPPTCTNPPSGKLGEACGTCNSGLRCDNSRCVIDDRRGCALDSSCHSGQCLAGFCSPRFEATTNNRICRQLALLCGDDNDCCTGACDAVEKQCTLTPTLLDGGTCTVDPITQACVAPGGATVCIGPHGSCAGDPPCCNGMACTNGTCF